MIDRQRREHPDPFLDWKVRIFFAGAALLMAGIVLGREILALVAAAVLAVGALLAVIGRARNARPRRTIADWEADAEEGPEEGRR